MRVVESGSRITYTPNEQKTVKWRETSRTLVRQSHALEAKGGKICQNQMSIRNKTICLVTDKAHCLPNLSVFHVGDSYLVKW